MNRKLLVGAFLLFVSMINPGCKHGKVDGTKHAVKCTTSHLSK
ncbi:hypothetical protein [Pedobacter nyackensis]|nr:hypothetical protein [Pedobacter nyackensis]